MRTDTILGLRLKIVKSFCFVPIERIQKKIKGHVYKLKKKSQCCQINPPWLGLTYNPKFLKWTNKFIV